MIKDYICKQPVVWAKSGTMASEMVFALDPNSWSDESKDEILSKSSKVGFRMRASPCLYLARRSYVAVGHAVEETRLERTVKDLILKLQQGYECATSPSSNNSSRPSLLKELCLVLQHQGLNARLVLPVPSGGSGTATCGRRRSTGEGGNCNAAATVAGKPCFFCSRQPYAVVQRSPTQTPSCPSTTASSSSSPPTARSRDVNRDDHPQRLVPQQEQLAFASEAPPTSSSGGAGGEILVEPGLRELFRVAPATPDYDAIVESLPQVWVGPRAALLELADGMCDAMALNFRSQGLDVPPWRRRAAVLSRWLQEANPYLDPLLEEQPGTGTRTRADASGDHETQVAAADGRDCPGSAHASSKVATAAGTTAAATAAVDDKGGVDFCGAGCGAARHGGGGVAAVPTVRPCARVPPSEGWTAGGAAAHNDCCCSHHHRPHHHHRPLHCLELDSSTFQPALKQAGWAGCGGTGGRPALVVHGFELPGPARAV